VRKRFPIGMNRSQRRHPYADAKYKVYALSEGAFGVKVVIPDAFPASVTKFHSRAAANRWIASHKQAVERQSAPTKHVLRFPMHARKAGR
jgi:hypothetical protein